MASNYNQGVVWEARYHAFGQASLKIDRIRENFRLPGQYFDSETALHQNLFREFNPMVSRYIERDPIGLAGGANLYSYAKSQPLTNYDVNGLLTTALDYRLATHFWFGNGESVWIEGYCPTYLDNSLIKTYLSSATTNARNAARRYNSGGGSARFDDSYRFRNTILRPWSLGDGYDNVAIECDFEKSGCCTEATCSLSAFRKDRFASPANLDRLFNDPNQDRPFFNLGGTPFDMYINCTKELEFSVCR